MSRSKKSQHTASEAAAALHGAPVGTRALGGRALLLLVVGGDGACDQEHEEQKRGEDGVEKLHRRVCCGDVRLLSGKIWVR